MFFAFAIASAMLTAPLPVGLTPERSKLPLLVGCGRYAFEGGALGVAQSLRLGKQPVVADSVGHVAVSH